MDKLTDLQLSEISRLLDERYVYLLLRLKRYETLFTNHPEWKNEIQQEIELIDSISKVL